MKMTDKEIMEQADDLMVTAGTDIKHQFALCVRKMNGRKYLFIHLRGKNGSYFSERDLITAIPIDRINDAANLIRY